MHQTKMRVLQRLAVFLVVQIAAEVTAQEAIYRTEVNGFRLGNVTTIGSLVGGRPDTLFPDKLRDDWWIPGNFLYTQDLAMFTFEPRSGVSHLVAGGRGIPVPSYREGVGSEARFSDLAGFTQLTRDKVLTISGHGSCIRQVNRRTNRTSLVAGTCETHGYVDGPLHKALFNHPVSIVTDRGNFGIVYVTDSGNKVIREINLNTRRVSTFFYILGQLALDPQGTHLYVGSNDQLGKINLRTKQLTLLNTNIARRTIWFRDGPLATAAIGRVSDMVFLNKDTLLVASPVYLQRRVRIVDLKKNTVSSVCSGREDIIGGKDGPIDQCALSGAVTIAVRPDKSGIVITGNHPVMELALSKMIVPPKAGRCPRVRPYTYIYNRDLDCHSDADCGGDNKCCFVSHIWPEQCLSAVIYG